MSTYWIGLGNHSSGKGLLAVAVGSCLLSLKRFQVEVCSARRATEESGGPGVYWTLCFKPFTSLRSGFSSTAVASGF